MSEKGNLRVFVQKNAANMLTLVRLLLTLCLLFVTTNLGESNVRVNFIMLYAALSIGVWISDFLDGRVARKWNIASVFGAYFDVTVDFFFVFLVHTQLIYYGVLPAWFLFVILEKSINYIVTSKVISRHNSDSFQFIRDGIGRVVSASFFVTPLVILFIHIYFPHNVLIIRGLLLILTFFALLSSLYRGITAVNLVKHKRR